MRDQSSSAATVSPVSTIRRVNRGFLEPLETPALKWLADRLPVWVTPDQLTAVGFLGAALIFVGYALFPVHVAFVSLASAGFAINWFGDSLDGTLARIRHIERPRYGFFVDNVLDVMSQFLLAVGLALSGILRPELALGGLAVFYMMSILSLVRAQTLREFNLDYGGIGMTEIRVFFVVLNVIIIILPPNNVILFGFLPYPNVFSLLWIATSLAAFGLAFWRDARILAQQDGCPK
jgi:phosphatidylglycerophosphate synthase